MGLSFTLFDPPQVFGSAVQSLLSISIPLFAFPWWVQWASKSRPLGPLNPWSHDWANCSSDLWSFAINTFLVIWTRNPTGSLAPLLESPWWFTRSKLCCVNEQTYWASFVSFKKTKNPQWPTPSPFTSSTSSPINQVHKLPRYQTSSAIDPGLMQYIPGASKSCSHNTLKIRAVLSFWLYHLGMILSLILCWHLLIFPLISLNIIVSTHLCWFSAIRTETYSLSIS